MAEELIRLERVSKYFESRKSVFTTEKTIVRAVDNITFSISKNEVVALVGESGSGKTTAGRISARLEKPNNGLVRFEGVDITRLSERDFNKKYRIKIQVIFQDPYEYLDPRMTTYDLIAEPLRYLEKNKEMIDEDVSRMMKDVQLTPIDEIKKRKPYELSGGQRQRIAIARALIVEPHYVVADEPISMLDSSIQMGVLRTLRDLKDRIGSSSLFITHDLAVAKYVADRILVMYKGKIVEEAKATELISNPYHPYTVALVEALPRLEPLRGEKVIHVLSENRIFEYGKRRCNFAERCPYSDERCRIEEPQLVEVTKNHLVACFHPRNSS